MTKITSPTSKAQHKVSIQTNTQTTQHSILSKSIFLLAILPLEAQSTPIDTASPLLASRRTSTRTNRVHTPAELIVLNIALDATSAFRIRSRARTLLAAEENPLRSEREFRRGALAEELFEGGFLSRNGGRGLVGWRVGDDLAKTLVAFGDRVLRADGAVVAALACVGWRGFFERKGFVKRVSRVGGVEVPDSAFTLATFLV